MMKKGDSIQSVSLRIMMITLLSKTLGFFRELIFSYFYGTTNIADAYIFSLTISTIIFGFIGTGLATSFIPVYTTVKEVESVEKANEFTSNIINIYMWLCIIIIIIFFPNTKMLVRLLASGFNQETTEISAYLCKFSIFTIIPTGIVSVLSGLLQTNKKYLLPAAIGIPLNVILIASIVISNKFGYTILGIGNLLAVYAEILFLISAIRNLKYKYRISFVIKDKYIRLIVSLSLPIIISASVNQINVLIDKSLASNIDGGVSILNYSHIIVSIVNDVVITAFVTTIYPRVTSAFVKKSNDLIKNIFSETLVSLMYILIPAAIFVAVCSKDIISFFFERGAFDSKSICDCSEVLKYYSLGIPFVGIRQLLIRFFYANKDTRTPVINASLAVIVNISLNYPLMRLLGLGGLALATSISAIIADVLLWVSMNKTIKLNINTQDRKDLIKLIIISCVLFIAVLFASNVVQLNIYIKLVLIFIIVTIVYIVCSYIFNVSCIKKFFRGINHD